MGSVIHFEIYATDPIRAVTFYKAVFGWKIEKWTGPYEYWLVTTGEENEPGINGGILKRSKPETTIDAATEGYICTIAVDSLDDTIRLIEEHGGKISKPKQAIAGVGWSAYAKDTEGNTFSLMQEDSSAS